MQSGGKFYSKGLNMAGYKLTKESMANKIYISKRLNPMISRIERGVVM
jgi:hypothetical protein